MRTSRILFILLASSTSLSLHGATPAESGKPPVLTVLERTTEPLLKADRPWEDFCLSSCQVLKVKGRWHIWYTSFDHHYRDDNDSYFCYARSKDGVHWEKPPLGLVAYDQRKNNNILSFGHNVGSVFLDEKAPAAERFKALAIRMVKGDVVGLWRNFAGRDSLEMAARAVAEEELRHGKRVHSRRQRLSALRANVERPPYLFRAIAWLVTPSRPRLARFPIRLLS